MKTRLSILTTLCFCLIAGFTKAQQAPTMQPPNNPAQTTPPIQNFAPPTNPNNPNPNPPISPAPSYTTPQTPAQPYHRDTSTMRPPPPITPPPTIQQTPTVVPH